MSEAAEPLLDARDIQGNIVPGFNRRQQYFASFSANDPEALRRALQSLPPLTTLETALGHRDERKSALSRGLGPPLRDDLWINVALSAKACDLIGAEKVRSLDAAFSRGMRPSLTGDPTARTLPDGTANPANRNHWIVGSPDTQCDVLLILAHDTDVESFAAPVLRRFAEMLGVAPSYVELGELLPGETEHFGFRDGISQPGLFGRVVVDGAERFITTRYGVPQQRGSEFGKPGQPLAWPGQFLTGQPEHAVDQPNLEPEFSNGSFLVLRRLRQDVAAFLADTERMAAELSSAGGLRVTGDELRARLIGRFPSGASLMRDQHGSKPVEGPLAINYFGFGTELPALTLSDGTRVEASQADPDVLRGRRCPVWAHTRKVNPRELGTDLGSEQDTLSFQMLRRGIPFGPAYNREIPESPEDAPARGLLFVAYQRHIEGQFGNLNRKWMNSVNGPSAGGFDLLVGQHVNEETGLYDAKSATYFAPSGPTDDHGIRFQADRQWIIPTGGAFLFAPSLRFFERFVHASAGVTGVPLSAERSNE